MLGIQTLKLLIELPKVSDVKIIFAWLLFLCNVCITAFVILDKI